MPYILIILEENMKVAIFTKNRVGRKPLKEDFMGGHGLLKDSKILTEREAHRPSVGFTQLLPAHALFMPLSKYLHQARTLWCNFLSN